MRPPSQFISALLTVALMALTASTCAADAKADAADDAYTVAAESYTAANWERAAAFFGEFIAAHPEDERARRAGFFLGESLVQLGRHDEASDRFERFLAEAGDTTLKAKATFRLGEAYFLGERHEQAATKLNEFVGGWPNDPLAEYALLYLGELALERGDAGEAERRLTEQLNRFPESGLRYDARLALARTYESQGHDDEAIAGYERVAAAETDQAATALYDLSALYFRRQQYAQVIATVRRLDDHWSGDKLAPRAWLTDGWAKLRLRDLDAARASFERIVAEAERVDDNLRIDARYGLAMTALEAGDDAAVVDVFEGLEIEPSHPLAATIAYQRADALRRVGKFEAALAGFEQLLSETQDEELTSRSQVAVLECLLALKRYDELQDRAHTYLDTSGDRAAADVRRLLAQSLTEHGQLVEAADELDGLVTSDGPALAHSDDLHRLAALRHEQGDNDEALRLVEKMAAELADGADVTPERRAAIGKLHVAILVDAKRYEDAIAVVDRLTTEQRAALPRPQLALLYAQVGRFADAAQQLVDADDDSRDQAYWSSAGSVADRALEAGDGVTAARLYENMASSGASSDTIAAGMLGRARCQWRDGHGDAALKLLVRIDEKYAEGQHGAEAALLRARIITETRGGDPAQAALRQVVDKYAGTPAAASALLRLAQMYEDTSQDKDAAEAYTRFVGEYPESANRAAAMLRGGIVLARLGRGGEAADLLTSLVEEYPSCGAANSARLRLARWALDRRDFVRARELVEAVLAADVVEELTADALYLQGLVAAAQGRWDDVDASIRRLLAEYPETPHRLDAEYWLSEAAYRRGEFARAQTLLDELVRKTQGRKQRLVAMARLRRAQLAARDRSWQDVIERGESLLSDFPAFEQRYEVDYLLGRALVARADFQQAREAFARVVRSPLGSRSETAAMAQWMIGESYFHQRDYASAREAFLLVDDRYDDFPQWQAAAILEAGKCSQQLEDWDDAARQFDRVVRQYPDSTHVGEARQRLLLAEQKSPSRTEVTK